MGAKLFSLQLELSAIAPMGRSYGSGGRAVRTVTSGATRRRRPCVRSGGRRRGRAGDATGSV
jgi:hypothetical protein